MESCQRCNSVRLVSITASDSEEIQIEYRGTECEKYAPDGIGIADCDALEFTYCVNCGQIQGIFPVSDDDVREAMKEHEDTIDDDNDVW